MKKNTFASTATEMQHPPINIATTQRGNPAVLASELHQKLMVKTPLRKWFPEMMKYGFEEGRDFYRADIFVQSANGMTKQKRDWVLSLDTAKGIAMIQRTTAGKAIRDYLIEQDKRVQSGALLSHEQVAALMDLVSVMGFSSVRDHCERLHYHYVGIRASWWAYRAKLLGYSAATLKAECEAIGKKYKSQKRALAHLDPSALVRAAVIDLFIALGKPAEYAKNLGDAAKMFAQKMPPLFDNDRAGGFDFMTQEQKQIIQVVSNPHNGAPLLAKF